MGNLETPETGGLAGMGVKLKAILGEQDPAAPTPATPEGQAADKAAAEPPVQEVIPAAPLPEAPGAGELPEWLRSPESPAPAPAPVESEEERLARLDKQVQVKQGVGDDAMSDLFIDMEGEPFRINGGWDQQDEALRVLTETRNLAAENRVSPNLTDENLDHAIAKVKAMKAAKEAEEAKKADEIAAAAAKGRRKDAEPLAATPESFAAKVAAARGLVATAAEEAGLLRGKISGDLKVADEMLRTDRETGLRIEEIPEEELNEARETLVKLRAPDSSLKFMDDSIVLQEQYRLGAEMAAAVEESMRAATKELKPGWFKTEPAVVREMTELQEFFDRTGNVAELRETVAEIEQEQKSRAWRNGGLTKEYKKQEEAELARARADLQTLESAEGFLARQDMPRVLGEAIAARRAGREYPYGTGPVANFRRKVYESIVGTLGIEAAPAVEAAAPAVALAPEPESEPAAPVETAEQIRQRVEEEFWGEDKLDPEVERVQAKLRGNVARGIANPKAVAEALAIQAEQSSEARRAVAAGAKQLAVSVLAEARSEKDSKKRQKMLTWVKDFGVGFEATSMAGSISLNVLDALISAIVNELGGQK